ncbi:MAG TPA: (2Fe-2S) ferredoxin domain-containing protein [Verrucomicrobiota bacterium]|nr:(2Fe-2S) ferredoxin domain-containing protein [Verrucomicrobiota bacterium]HRT07616.1 (2Fe-2S) ferredoxin domain-containing protein [Candidatus Paceibacterota bacterium]HRT56623.1 (2Fe-2S) ferredoxin domain-containing protein [Candidatus Paceibacterota bacterium]
MLRKVTMTPECLTSIAICMGSSCFMRGNNRNIEVIQNYLRTTGLPPGVELSGHLCEGHCTLGPNLTINGKRYHQVDPVVILGLLKHYLGRNRS